MDPQAPNFSVSPIEDPPPPQIPVSKFQPPKDNHWISILAMAIFVLFSLGVVAFLYYQNQQLKQMLASYQPTPVASPTPTATPDPTANWKTYTNTAGYSIKYPASFTTQLMAAGAGNKEASSTARNLFIFESGMLEPYAERYINLEIFQNKPIYNLGTATEVMLDNRTAEKIVIAGAKFDIYSAQVGDKGFLEISVSNDPTKKETANQILSTFKFSDTTPPGGGGLDCQYNGKTYKDGSAVPSGDTCNTCSCDNGKVACTTMACQ